MISPIIVSAFPGTGKTYMSNYYTGTGYHCFDSDSSKFDKSAFPINYIAHIKSLLEQKLPNMLIFVSSHKEVRMELVKENMWFYLMYPNISLKREYMERYKKRNNTKEFMLILETYWEKWITELENQRFCTHIRLRSEEYITNIMLML